MDKILVTGANGQLGYDVCRFLEIHRCEYFGATRIHFDIADEKSTSQFIKGYRPSTVIHCAAWTAVDKAEQEPKIAWAVNADGTRNIAKACQEVDAKLLYISTDYVFPGLGTKFYETTDPTGPLNFYGESKLAGEKSVQELLEKFFIVRISWVFGKNGNNFVKTMLRLSESHKSLRIVSDQIGSPTYTPDLAPLLANLAKTDFYGIYHVTNEETCSWAEFAKEIFSVSGKDVFVEPIKTSEYPTPAKRPLNSRLSKKKLDEIGFNRLPSWKDATRRFLNDK